MRIVAILMALLFCSGCSSTVHDARVRVVSASDDREIAGAKVVVARRIRGMFDGIFDVNQGNFPTVQWGLTSPTGEFQMRLLEGHRFDFSVSSPGFVEEKRTLLSWTKKEHSDLIEFKLQPIAAPLESSVRDPSR